jgi:hypothetical protein
MSDELGKVRHGLSKNGGFIGFLECSRQSRAREPEFLSRGQKSNEMKSENSVVWDRLYQTESDLYRLVTPHYKRAEDEGRTLVQSALASAADIEVSETELRILVAPLSSAHRTRVLATLCGELNATATPFPGTNLILRYEVGEVGKR